MELSEVAHKYFTQLKVPALLLGSSYKGPVEEKKANVEQIVLN